MDQTEMQFRRNEQARKGAVDTSRRAYLQQVLSGKAKTQRQKILALMDSYQIPLNRRQISNLTGIPINAVTGRVNALIKSNLVDIDHVARDPQTHRITEYLRLV